MKNVKHFAIPFTVSLAAALILFSYVDRTESKVVIAVGGFGLFLAWYSILDLREQRGERWLPHTFDRMLRATFTVITLAFVVNLALPSPPPIIVDPVQPERVRSFIREIEELALQSSTWNSKAVEEVVVHHFSVASPKFSKVECAGGLTFYFNDKPKLKLRGDNTAVTFEMIP